MYHHRQRWLRLAHVSSQSEQETETSMNPRFSNVEHNDSSFYTDQTDTQADAYRQWSENFEDSFSCDGPQHGNICPTHKGWGKRLQQCRISAHESSGLIVIDD